MKCEWHRAVAARLPVPAWCCDQSGQISFGNRHFKPDMLDPETVHRLTQAWANGDCQEQRVFLQIGQRREEYLLHCEVVEHPIDRLLCLVEALHPTTNHIDVVNRLLIHGVREREQAVRDLQQVTERLASVIHVQQRLAQAELDLPRFAQQLAEELCRLTAADACCLHLFDDAPWRLHIQYGRENITADLTTWIRQQRPERLTIVDAERFPALDGSLILAPIVQGGQSLGVATLYAAVGKHFEQQDLQTLELLTGMLGSALMHQKDFEMSARLIDERTEMLATLSSEVEKRRTSELALRASETRLQEIIEASHECYLSFGLQGRITMLNAEAAHLLGDDKNKLLGRNLSDFLRPPSDHLIARALRIYERRQRLCWLRRRHDVPMRDAHGHDFIAEASFSATGQGHHIEFHVFLHDITQRKHAEEELRRSQAQLRSVADSIPAHLAYVDAQQRYLYANSALGQAMGLEPEQIVGRRLEDLLGSNAYEHIAAPVAAALLGQPGQCELTLNTCQGPRRFESRLIPEDHAGREQHGFYLVAWDIDERWHEARRLHDAATHDALTGFFNRQAFLDLLQEHLQAAPAPAHALLYIDLDNFKQINDVHGHAVGDAVLQIFSGRLRSCVRIDDYICRIGGDEFLVLLKQVSRAEPAQRITRKIIEAMREPLVLKQLQLQVTLSVGIAVHGGETAADLIARADGALYRAKAGGRSRYVVA